MTRPLMIQVAEKELEDLRDRLRRTRLPKAWPLPEDWHAGVPRTALIPLAERWSAFDWRAAEARINALPWHSADIDGLAIGYLRFEGQGAAPTPIVLTNGWPSSVLELVPLARHLVEDIDGLSFTVIIPALPGFPGTEQSASLPPATPTHDLWHRLMHDTLGFTRYVAHGGDLGAGTASLLAQTRPEAVIGLHLLAVAEPAEVEPSSITAQEQAHLDQVATWFAEDGAYEHQQMTRPLTLSYALSDSPVGLLAWILEKYHDWTDGPEDRLSALDEDFILTQASLYWFTDAIGTSFRPYYEHARGHSEPIVRVSVPTAIALFPKDLSHPPRSWAARTYDVVRFTELHRGGHFAASEVPELLAQDIRAFVHQVEMPGSEGDRNDASS